MAVTIEQVLAYLRADEVRYEEAARLGPDALPHLLAVVEGPDAGLAAKAAYLAALIRGERSVEVVRAALAHREPAVRVAGAAAVGLLPEETAEPLLETALGDADVGVRRLALERVPRRMSPHLRAALEKLARIEPDPGLRRTSEQLLRHKGQP